MNKIFISGDTHGGYTMEKLFSKSFPDGKKLTKDDYLIIAGDFGFVFHSEETKTERYWLKWFIEKPWTTLFVCGNHENHHRLAKLPTIQKFGGIVGVVNDSIFYLKRGEIYTIGEKKIFCFGGAKSRDIAYRKLNVSYWVEEVPSTQEMQYAVDNLTKHDGHVDYIIAHTAPDTIISLCGLSSDYIDPTTRFLEFIVNNTKFDRFFCGHLHMDKTISKYTILYEDVIEI